VGYPALPGTILQFHCKKVPCRLIKWPCGLWVGVSPPQIKFLYTNPPQGATFVCWPPPNYQSIHPHLLGWTLQAQGEPPTNKICMHKPTLRSNFCLLAPAQFFTLWGFSDGVTIGGTPGVKIWGRPLARCWARVKWGAHAKFRGDGLCGSGGSPPDTHTHTHTPSHTHTHTPSHTHTHILSPLYIR
jgi:hypothetical protein